MSASFIQANTNGRLHSAHEPSLSPLNRGFLYGDAIYEVWRTYHGVIFAWEEHGERLTQSAQALHLLLPLAPAAMLAEIKRTAAAFRTQTQFVGELYIRLQITRGGGPIGLDVGLADRPDYVILVQPCPLWSPDVLATGIRLSLATGLRRNPAESLNPAWKTGNYLNNILALREARARGADEVLMLNRDGAITEAAVSNVAFVRDGVVLTPSLAAGILSGVTRRILLERVAAVVGIQTKEAIIEPGDLAGMEECFLLSSTKDLTPVAIIDGIHYKVSPDTITTRLKHAFANYTREYAVQRSELAV